MEIKAQSAVFIGNFIFGFSFIFSRLALGVTTPLVLLAYRFLIAFLLMSFLLLAGIFKINIKNKNIKPLIILGLLQPVLYFLGENYGIMYSNATFSAVMIALIPVFSAISARVFLKERTTYKQWLFCIMSIVGVIVMAVFNSASGEIKIIGIVLLLIAVIAETGYFYLGKRISGDFSAFERTYIMMLCGTVFFVISAILENFGDIHMLTAPLYKPVFIVSVLYLSVLSSVVAFLLINFGATHLSVARTGIFANVTSVVSVFAGVIFLKESCTIISIISSVLILAGVWGVQVFSCQGDTIDG